MKKVNSNKTPIYRDSGFFLGTTEKTLETFQSEAGHPHEPENYIYSRYRNPTVVAAEKHIARVENSNWALLTQSGMAAIDIALSIFQQADSTAPWLFFTEIYGGTNSFIDLVLTRRRGVNIQRFAPEGDGYSLDSFVAALDKYQPKLVYFEAISNPMLLVADVKAILAETKKKEESCLLLTTPLPLPISGNL